MKQPRKVLQFAARRDDRPSDPPAVRALFGWSQHAAFDAAMALASCRDGAGDLRPEILLWRFAGDCRHESQIARRLAALVVASGALSGVLVAPAVAGGITADAMRMTRDRVRIAADARAKQLGIRKGTYLGLRDAAEAALLKHICGGLIRYLDAWNGTTDTLCYRQENSRERHCRAA